MGELRGLSWIWIAGKGHCLHSSFTEIEMALWELSLILPATLQGLHRAPWATSQSCISCSSSELTSKGSPRVPQATLPHTCCSPSQPVHQDTPGTLHPRPTQPSICPPKPGFALRAHHSSCSPSLLAPRAPTEPCALGQCRERLLQPHSLGPRGSTHSCIP